LPLPPPFAVPSAVNLPLASDDPPAFLHESTAISPSLIDSELTRITRSKSFQQSRRHQQLLRHLVEQTVAGNAAALKEPLLALQVFERPLDAFDPARDTIVRVEARRLRQRLARYYGEEGIDATLEIRLPVGSYVPTLRRRGGVDQAATRQARDLVERGEYFLRQPLSKDTLEAALARFDAALRESPEYVSAFVGMGRSWLNLATGWHLDPRVAGEHAAEALHRALALEPNQAVAQALLGAIQHQFEYDWPAANASFQRALVLAPHLAFVHSAYGCHLFARGDHDAAERELLLARRLDPQYINTRMHMVNLRLGQGRLDDAEAELDAMRDIAPTSMPAVGLAALLAIFRGDAPTALLHYQRVCELAPDHPNAHAGLAVALGMSGDIAAADAKVAFVLERFGADRVSPYLLAIVAIRCGRKDHAFALLERAIERRDPNVMMLGTDTSFADLHVDPRWAPLVESRVPRREE
jgi:tetratricopeptide (TPR) repeat protein